MTPKDTKLIVKGAEISFIQDTDFISLTDLAKRFSEDSSKAIENWMRNKDSIEFLGLWETLNNPDFKPPEFEGFRNEAGTNRFLMSPTKWIKATDAIGIQVKSGRYNGGTFAHMDIALEFASWISPGLKLFIIQEFQRLKKEEAERLSTGRDVKRILAAVNYRAHTDAIRDNLIPEGYKAGFYIYATEADMLNKIVFGETHGEWKQRNQSKKGNQRDDEDNTSVEQLVVLASLESINAMLIDKKIPQRDREQILAEHAQKEIQRLLTNQSIKRLK